MHKVGVRNDPAFSCLMATAKIEQKRLMKKNFSMLLLLFLSITPVHAAEWILQYNPDPDPNATSSALCGEHPEAMFLLLVTMVTILHTTDNGANWNPMNSGIPQTIYGIWGSSVNNVFAVADQGVIIQYNGSTWNGMTSPVTTRLRERLWVCGKRRFRGRREWVILRYNGTVWSAMDSTAT